MATTAKKAAAKKAAPKKTEDKTVLATARDPLHPEIHPDRHAKSGMQEAPTAGGADPNPTGEPAGGGAGARQASFDPQPSIGVTHDEATEGKSFATVDEDAEHVYSLEQALGLPVVTSGTPVKMPTDAQLKAEQKKQSDKANAAAKRRNDLKKGDDKSPDEDEDVTLPIRKPILGFKNADRQTMLVVKTKDGLGAMLKEAA